MKKRCYFCKQKEEILKLQELLEQVLFATVSVIGSVISYFMLIIYPPSKDEGYTNNVFKFRCKRWKQIIESDKRVLIFDVVFSCVIIGIAYTIIILEVVNYRQALLGGLTAEAFVYNYIHNARNQNQN